MNLPEFAFSTARPTIFHAFGAQLFLDISEKLLPYCLSSRIRMRSHTHTHTEINYTHRCWILTNFQFSSQRKTVVVGMIEFFRLKGVWYSFYLQQKKNCFPNAISISVFLTITWNHPSLLIWFYWNDIFVQCKTDRMLWNIKNNYHSSEYRKR